MKCPKSSAVFSHFCDSGGDCSKLENRPSLDDFSVLCSAKFDLALQVKETLLIRKEDPLLNRNVSSLPPMLLSYFLLGFLLFFVLCYLS